ncbi:sulfur oxidation c-type cytochrome SoxX [Limibacillus halophilus]|jgi:sulfur-oxidizing protein SoxX
MVKKTLIYATGAAALLLLAGQQAGAGMSYEIVDMAIPKPLTDQAGDAANGRATVIDRKLGNCLACHQITDIKEQQFHGEVGPPLDGVAERWEEGQLRLIVANSKAVFDGTIMPAFLVTEGFNHPLDKFEGKSILTPQQVEDVVAYLKTLK